MKPLVLTALAGAGMVVCGLVLRQQRRAAAAASPAKAIAPPVLAPVPRFFPDGGPNCRVVPFGRKGETLSETKLTRHLVRRAERVCAVARARADDEIR